MTELPASVRIGYRSFVVEAMSPMAATGKDVFGECDSCLGVIRIRADLDPVKAANTLLHEVMHACWYVAGLDDDDKEERIVTVFANQLSQVWRDNPALIAWINERLGISEPGLSSVLKSAVASIRDATTMEGFAAASVIAATVSARS